MKKKRKKPNTFKEQKLHRAHLKNEYLAKLSRVYREFTGKDLFRVMPQHELDYIFERRLQAYKVMAASGHKIPVVILNNMKALVNSWLKQLRVTLPMTGQEVGGRDFYSLYVSLIAYANDTKTDDFARAAEFKESLQPYKGMMELYFATNTKLSAIMFNIAMLNSDLEKQVYTFNYEVRDYFNDRPGCFIILDIYGFHPETMQIDIEGTKRPAVKVGWINENPKPCFVYAEMDCTKWMDVPDGETGMLPVYIQHHALLRLRERVDVELRGLLYDSLYESLRNPVTCRNSKGYLLIEYRYTGIKTGYLRADIHDNILLIHTFLFLTNNGTPEGELLHEITGLRREDKTHLAIDKLSTFMASDIKNNAAVKEIFIKSGCGSLFDIDPEYAFDQESGIKEKPLAMRIAHYLGIKIDEEFMEDMGEEREEENY